MENGIFILDDAHFMDDASRLLLVDLFTKSVTFMNQRISLVISIDTADIKADSQKEFESIATDIIDINPLETDQIHQLIIDARPPGTPLPKEVHPRVVEFVLNKSSGNAFIAEMIVQKLFESNWLFVHDEIIAIPYSCMSRYQKRSIVLEALEVPTTISSLIQQRLDKLDANLSLVLKVASVIGMKFSFQTLKVVFPSEVAAYGHFPNNPIQKRKLLLSINSFWSMRKI